MANGNYVLPAPETITITGDAARRLIGCGSGDAALVYLYILNAGGRFDRDDAALRTGRTPDQIDAAMDTLARLGLVNGSAGGGVKPERPDEIPQYTTDDIKREMENGETFRLLVNEAQAALGKLLSSDDLIKLFGIYDYLNLPPEVILHLIYYCKDENARRYGPGRVPTMRYIEKAAFTWEREGIFSIEAAETYLKRLNEKRGIYILYGQAMGIYGRELSVTERKYIDAWADLGFTPEAIAIAYDRTVFKTNKLSWRYMNSIIMSWHSKGLHTPQEIEERDPFGQPGKAHPESAGQSGKNDMDRMRKTLRRIKGE